VNYRDEDKGAEPMTDTNKAGRWGKYAQILLPGATKRITPQEYSRGMETARKSVIQQALSRLQSARAGGAPATDSLLKGRLQRYAHPGASRQFTRAMSRMQPIQGPSFGRQFLSAIPGVLRSYGRIFKRSEVKEGGREDAPGYQMADSADKRCGSCWYLRNSRCDLYDFEPSPDYVCDDYRGVRKRGELRGFVRGFVDRCRERDLNPGAAESAIKAAVCLGGDCGEAFQEVLKVAHDESEVAKSTVTKKNSAEMIPGGLASDQADSKYPPEQLERGERVEREHTDDEQTAREIAKDHLEEDREYYDKLEQVEDTDGDIEDAGRAPTEEDKADIRQYIATHEDLQDETFHQFMEERGINPHMGEAAVYEMAHSMARGKGLEGREKAAWIQGFVERIGGSAIRVV
jgi:hypothetical protein